MEELQGGNSNQVIRDGDTVLRNMGKWSPFVHQFLNHLHDSGFVSAPQFIEIVDEHERLTYLDGEVGHYPLKSYMLSDDVVISAAKLLRQLHDISLSFTIPADAEFMLSDVSVTEYEVIGHNDFAPYNCVFRDEQLVGIFDFDTASPTSRLWDIAYAVYRFCPLATDKHCYNMGFQIIPDRKHRLDLFCSAYGLQNHEQLLPTVITRLQALISHMQITNSNLEHVRVYQNDIAYIQQNLATLS